jgi:predicted component of type VI protein secretion system
MRLKQSLSSAPLMAMTGESNAILTEMRQHFAAISAALTARDAWAKQAHELVLQEIRSLAKANADVANWQIEIGKQTEAVLAELRGLAERSASLGDVADLHKALAAQGKQLEVIEQRLTRLFEDFWRKAFPAKKRKAKGTRKES